MHFLTIEIIKFELLDNIQTVITIGGAAVYLLYRVLTFKSKKKALKSENLATQYSSFEDTLTSFRRTLTENMAKLTKALEENIELKKELSKLFLQLEENNRELKFTKEKFKEIREITNSGSDNTMIISKLKLYFETTLLINDSYEQ